MSHGAYDKKVDVWSAGLVLYMALTKKEPFKAANQTEYTEKVINKEPDYKGFTKFSPQALDLCKKMLLKDQTQRLDARECLEHEWFSSDL